MRLPAHGFIVLKLSFASLNLILHDSDFNMKLCVVIVLLLVSSATAHFRLARRTKFIPAGYEMTQMSDLGAPPTMPSTAPSANQIAGVRQGEIDTAKKLQADQDAKLSLSKKLLSFASNRFVEDQGDHDFAHNANDLYIQGKARALVGSIEDEDANIKDLTRQVGQPHQDDVVNDAKSQLVTERSHTQAALASLKRAIYDELKNDQTGNGHTSSGRDQAENLEQSQTEANMVDDIQRLEDKTNTETRTLLHELDTDDY
jgi:hypothetical protein